MNANHQRSISEKRVVATAIYQLEQDEKAKRLYAYKDDLMEEIQQPDVEYPESDGEPMGETGYHVRASMHLYSALDQFFSDQDDVYVAADMFMYYEKGNPAACKAPDVMMIKGAGHHERRIFKVWEEKVVPAVIFEITSTFSVVDDTFHKAFLYSKLGVREYFLFDPLQEYLSKQLIGFRLHQDVYVDIEPDKRGWQYSEELGLFLSPEKRYLRAIDPQTNQPIPSLREALFLANQEAQRANQEAQRAEQEAQRAEKLAAQLRAMGIEPED